MDNEMTSRVHGVGMGFLLAIAGLAGCDPFGGGPAAEGESYMRRAKNLCDAKDYPAAAAAYEKALQCNPDLAQAHLELGLIYDDKLNDPVAAIYHYRRYLALKPNTDKRQLVQDFIERARLSLAAKLPQSPIVDPSELTRLQNEKAALMAENAQLRRRIAELEKTPVAHASRPVTPPAAPAVPAAPTQAPVAAAAPPPPKGRIHTVAKGDTLQSLAYRYYGTRAAWDKIYQANRNSLATKDQLKLGQELVIP
jgi:tetratricopeptide (TPR) repeat protein